MDSTKSSDDVLSVDVNSAKELLGSGHRYLDVRTKEEYDKGHVENALNIPYMFINQQGRVKNPEFMTQISLVCQKDDHLVVACNSGGRGLKACVDLLNVGFNNVKNMKGGYSAWVDNEFKGDEKSADEELKDSTLGGSIVRANENPLNKDEKIWRNSLQLMWMSTLLRACLILSHPNKDFLALLPIY
ncbi:hypothetical protein Leryth_020992 [Lithospermum erythrorhizon]|nr:hypothetical protein Leryth_020992 [Lithospermum erythrorhizon]